MNIRHFFHRATNTFSYLISKNNDALLIDSVADYDASSSALSWSSAEHIASILASEKLQLHYILETHIHADHISASQYFKSRFPTAKIGIGQRVSEVQKIFSSVYNQPGWPTDGSQFDLLIEPGPIYRAGGIEFKIIETPGHTPACITFQIEENIFTGDSLFMPDFGSGRCDFPGGSAKDLFVSIKKLFTLPDQTTIYVGHDYGPGGREIQNQSTIKLQKRDNIHISETTTESEFVKFRTQRDLTLAAPRLLLPSLQINLNAGKIPPAEANGVSYLKIPLTVASE